LKKGAHFGTAKRQTMLGRVKTNVERETRPSPGSHLIKTHFQKVGEAKQVYEGKCIFGNSHEKYLKVGDFDV